MKWYSSLDDPVLFIWQHIQNAHVFFLHELMCLYTEGVLKYDLFGADRYLLFEYGKLEIHLFQTNPH